MNKKYIFPHLNIVDLCIDLVQIPDVVRQASEWIRNREFGNYIVVANANDVVMAKKDLLVREAVSSSSLVVPDGISLLFFCKLKGHLLKNRVYGPDLMLELLRYSESQGYANFFYGATEKVLNSLVKNLKLMFPNLRVAGIYAPPFRKINKREDEIIIDAINKSVPDIVWVGLGCPKQQLWMYEHKDKLKVPVMVGVGAAFDFLSGTKPQAPRWMRDSGFEWFFRLITEPKRLWRRYLVNYPLFIYYVLTDLIKSHKKPCET